MPKQCEQEGCSNNIWSRKTMRCKNHQVAKDYSSRNNSKIKRAVKRIKQVSSKRQQQNQSYLVMRKIFLDTNPNCVLYKDKPSTEIHHSAGRRGDMLLDTRYWFALCREAHMYIHANPEWAEDNGFLIKGRNSRSS